MQLLYGFGMLAVFVLCLALLSTARRILRTSPLSNTQFGTTRMYEVDQVEELMEGISSTRIHASNIASNIDAADVEAALITNPILEPNEAQGFDATSGQAAPAIHLLAETAIPAESTQESPAVPTVLAFSEPAELELPAAPARASKWARFPKPTRQAYNYAFECLLIGVSAWVLFKTQRDTFHSAAAALSRNRVA